MRGRIQQRPAHLLLPRWQELYPAAEWLPQEPSFHASLLDCAQNCTEDLIAPRIERETAEPPVAAPAPQSAATVAKQPGPGALKRAWTWLQAKNAAAAAARQLQTSGGISIEEGLLRRSKPSQAVRPSSSNLLARGWSWLQERSGASPTKRLRVADFTALGEKRFVALVKVEGREFLIGGGASGVSLLTKLEAEQEPASELRREFAFREESE